MACGNNNNRGGNLGGLKNILDFNVTYTGCETSCGGREIKTGDSLRNVLDALVANCDGGSGPSAASTNFWFSRNVPTFTVDVKDGDFALTGAGAIYEFVGGEWQNTGIQIGGGGGGESVWGQITGAIADQTDLTEYINLLITEAPLSIDKFGENFHKKDGDEKVQLGRYFGTESVPDAKYIIISLDDFDVLNPQDFTDNAALSMLKGPGTGVMSEFRSTGANIIASGGTFGDDTSGSLVKLDQSQNTAYLRNSVAFVGIGPQIGTLKGLQVAPDGSVVNIRIQNGGSIWGEGFTIINHMGSYNQNNNGLLRLGPPATSNNRTGGIDIYRDPATSDNNLSIVLGFWDNSNSRYVNGVKVGYGALVQVTEDYQFAHKRYVDESVQALETVVSAQAAQIADLIARIEALENA